MVGRGKTLGSAKKATPQSRLAGLLLSVGRISKFLKAGKYTERVGAGYPVNLAAVLEYLAAEVLELDVEGVGSESTTSNSRYATIIGDGLAVCWQKEIEIQRRKEEMLEKNVQSVPCIERALKK
ncbi:hypothetical protein EZV62_007951 [Acer yangbiense]|uniref:Histone H2A n=1 Tax=Acer yangbiense TaxID=1000413 RepID=A0A5C7IE51_9ROSI|nr:hypothetical protein EZV62_007951 [Acer yangbiense]